MYNCNFFKAGYSMILLCRPDELFICWIKNKFFNKTEIEKKKVFLVVKHF